MTQDEFREYLQKKHNKAFLSKRDLAKEIGVSNGTIDAVRRKGGIRSKKILGQVFFDIGEVARFMAEA